MERGITTLKALALATVPVVGLFVVLLLLQVSSVVVKAGKDEQVVASQSIAALSTINRQCSSPGNIQPCGTLAEVDKTLTDLSYLSVQSQKGVRDADRVAEMEMKLLPEWNASLTSTLEHVDVATVTINTSAKQLTAATLPVLGSTNDVLSSADATVKHLDTLVQSPEVKDSLKNVAASTKSIADGTAQADAILADGRKVADRYLNPPPKRWYEKVWVVAKFAAQTAYDFIR